MYFIKQIIIDDKQNYQKSKIIDNTNRTITGALALLEQCVIGYVKEERGREAAIDAKIVDITNFDQIIEPQMDCIQLYRLDSDPYCIHVYQKKTSVIESANWAWRTSKSLVTNFRRTTIFELEQYEKQIGNSYVPPPPPIRIDEEMVLSGAVHVPKKMTVSPMCDVISELKKSSKFQSRFLNLQAINSVIANDLTSTTNKPEIIITSI